MWVSLSCHSFIHSFLEYIRPNLPAHLVVFHLLGQDCLFVGIDTDSSCFVTYQVRKFVIRREVQPKGEGKKSYTKAPRIQRLVTPQRLQHKRHRMALKRRQAESSKDAAVCPTVYLPTLIYIRIDVGGFFPGMFG